MKNDETKSILCCIQNRQGTKAKNINFYLYLLKLPYRRKTQEVIFRYFITYAPIP